MPKETRKMYINKDEMVYFKNENDLSTKINFKLDRGVKGMRRIEK
jgi:hypothetical protein